MIIGVDAGMLGSGDVRLQVGVWRVAVNLLQQLGKRDPVNHYRLYSFSPIPKPLMRSLGDRMENKVLPSLAYHTLQLPIELRLRPVDAYLGLAQAIPLGAPSAIGFCYDLGFLRFPAAYPGSVARLKRQTTEMAQRSASIITISESTKQDLIDFYRVAEGKITVAYPGVDERFSHKGASHKETHPYFLCVGALKRGKNIPFALTAFATFLTRYPKPYVLCIAGGTYWEDPHIAQTIKTLHLEKHVRLMGHVSDGELPALYRGATALLVPSLWEGFCLPAAEAMRCGTPVLYSASGSLPEIVGEGGMGFVPGDEQQAVATMIAVASDRDVRSKLQTRAMSASQKYTWQRFAAQVLSALTP